MTRTLRTDYEVRNTIGVCLYTSSAKDLAVQWAKNNTARLGSLTVEEVTLHETRRRVYRPRTPALEAREGRAA